MANPLARPPLQLPKMLRALHDHSVDWVLSGSTVLALYGAEIIPNDLDVVPDPTPANLHRLATLLETVDASPAYVPDWRNGPTLQQCQAWRPAPPTQQHLDHLFVTTLGMLDVPPTLTGTYAQLRPTATLAHLAGVPVHVCAPTEVLNRIPTPPRPKDLERAATYAALKQRLRTNPHPRLPT